MTPSTLLHNLSALGVSVSAIGDKLHIVAPAGAVGPDLCAELVTHKAELLAMLSGCRHADEPVRPPAVLKPDPAPEPPPTPIQLRPQWVMLPHARFVEVPPGSTIPAGAIYQCREGDETWTPIKGRPISTQGRNQS